MADFVAVLKKTIDGLSDNTPALREKVYRKARETVAAKLAAIDPPPSKIVVERQSKALEDAIKAVEAGYSDRVEAPDDFESVLAGLRQKSPPALSQPAFPKPADTPPDEEPEEAALTPPTPPASAPEQERVETGEPPAGGSGGAPDEELRPVEPVRRPEPALARPLSGAEPAAHETPSPVADGNRRRISGGLVAALVVLLVLGGAGYGIWLNRGEFGAMLGFGGPTVVADEPAEPTVEAETDAETAEPTEQQVAAAEPDQAPEPAQPEQDVVKFTQRLTAEGKEIDEGPGGDEPSIGEGTSLAAATQTAETPATQPAPTAETSEQAAAQPAEQADAALPVGQRAFFYEERTNVAEGSADAGSTVWSLVQESPGADLPPEPAIRAEVTIPQKDAQLRMTIRRNADKTLPASHIVEMIFLGSFEGGGIDSVLQIALKSSEAAAGNPLIGIPAKIADGYFLVALSDGAAEQQANLQLLLRQGWFDIPIVYRSGRRALFTMEKGVPGDRVFQEALQAWQNASSG